MYVTTEVCVRYLEVLDHVLMGAIVLGIVGIVAIAICAIKAPKKL